MSGFSADWLTLREPYDQAARNASVLEAVIEAQTQKSALRIVDLACGTGSTLRSVGPLMSCPQSWRLCDYDRALLAHAGAAARPAHVTVETCHVDLNADLEQAFAGPIDLVTTSALLDLVSAEWIDRLVAAMAARGLSFYAALSYDGRIELFPSHQHDARMIEAVNRHQHGDKGFGPALGPDAASYAIARLRAHGFAVTTATADWKAGVGSEAFQSALLSGWSNAARQTGLEQSDVAEWTAFRTDAIERHRAQLIVGHVDFFAVPAKSR